MVTKGPVPSSTAALATQSPGQENVGKEKKKKGGKKRGAVGKEQQQGVAVGGTVSLMLLATSCASCCIHTRDACHLGLYGLAKKASYSAAAEALNSRGAQKLAACVGYPFAVRQMSSRASGSFGYWYRGCVTNTPTTTRKRCCWRKLGYC